MILPALHEFKDVAVGVLEEADAEAGRDVRAVNDRVGFDAVAAELLDGGFEIWDLEREVFKTHRLFAAARCPSSSAWSQNCHQDSFDTGGGGFG